MKTLCIEAKLERLKEVLAFLDGILEEADCPPKAQMQLEIALEEMFVNIAHYAYEKTDVPKAEQFAEITVCVTESDGVRYALVRLCDRGIPYNPLAKADPDTTLSATDRPIGGLGIYMVKKSMDRVEYEYRDGRNIFTMGKKLS